MTEDPAPAETVAPPSAIERLRDDVTAALGGIGDAVTIAYGEVNISVAPAKVLAALAALKTAHGLDFAQLTDLTAVDHPERMARFDVVYHLLSFTRNARLRVKVAVEEDEVLPTAIPVHVCANWFEREIFDMFGIAFADHPDLRRILTDYGFQGHPLRKDFPMTGHVEVRYDLEQRRVVYEPVKLTQDFRAFDFMSPWEGAPYILPGDEKARDPA